MDELQILLLEDKKLDADAIEATLDAEEINYRSLVVSTRNDFIQALQTNAFDLILSDYSLPGFDGRSALEIARNLCPDVPFIFVSGTLGEELAIETLKSGATDYVLKHRLERLVPSVQRALREARERLKRKRAEAALHQLLECAKNTGSEFFDGLVRTLAEFFQVRYAFVGEIKPNEPSKIRTLAAWVDGQLVENIEYELAGTPCENVIQQQTCFYPSKVTALFPQDEILAQMGVESYLGTPLLSSNGQTLGLLEILDDRPMDETFQSQELLQIFAAQAAAELERDRAISELRQSEQQFRQLADAMPQIVWIADPQGKPEYVSQQWIEYTGLTLEQTRDRNNILETIHSDDFEPTYKIWENCLSTGTIYHTEFRLKQAMSQEYRWFLCRAMPVKNEREQIVHWYGTLTDIDEHKRLENALQQQTEQLVQANRIKDEFLAVLSHELRSPLNPILGWATLLQNRKLEESVIQQGLQTIERNAKLQTQLIEDLLDVSRILRGKLSLNIAPVNLVSIVEGAIDTVHLAAQAKSIEIKTNLDASVGMVLGDLTRLQQVIWNLLSNAVKFTPSGGKVEVRLEKAEGRGIQGASALSRDRWQIVEGGKKAKSKRQKEERSSEKRRKNENEFSQNLEGNSSVFSSIPDSLLPTSYAQITVTDTGQGISADFLPYVFDYFRQADSAITRKFGGLGLGLAICRYLVEMHGGTITADSLGNGRGATFTVQLPLMTSARLSKTSAFEPKVSPTLNGIKVLVVDDELDSRELLCVMLKEAGAETIAVASAREALQTLSQTKPDAIVSDIGMPEMDGYMLLRQIRSLSLEQGGKIPAIALTAYAGEIDRQQTIAAGYQKHITKPVVPEQLVTAIAELVKNSSTSI